MNQISRITFGTDTDTTSSTSVQNIDGLSAGEKMILRSYRSWIVGWRDNTCQPWNAVWNMFMATFGDREGKAALAWFVRMLNALRAHSTHTIRFHHPGCPCLCPDEIAFLGIAKACARGDAAQARDRAQDLVGIKGISDLVGAASQLVLIAEKHGIGFEPKPGITSVADLAEMSVVSTAHH